MKRRNLWYSLCGALLIALVCGGVLFVPVGAKYIKQTNKLVNTFAPADSTPPQIEETFENNVKKDVAVSVGNTGYPVYVRVEVVVSWKNEAEGLVYFQAPVEGEDYTLVRGDSQKWVEEKTDGKHTYYYYTQPVNSGETTDILIKTCEQIGEAPEGYILSVNIVAQILRADEYPTYRDAWGLQSSAEGD